MVGPAGALVSTAQFRPCALIPTYDNPKTVGDVVDQVRSHGLDVVVVDDGSAEPGRTAVEELGRTGRAHVHHREHNGGKGAAVKTGFSVARELGYTHALQIDADGQHALDDIPKFMAAASDQPDALVLGAPQYDESAPRGRLVGRQITRFWTNLETFGPVIDDPMCGFRVYPLEAVSAVNVAGNRMDFDIEIAVRLVWAGLAVINLPTKVRYVSAEAGGVSHFQMFRDNVRISFMHARLFIISRVTRLWRWLTRSK